jgi:hypothetical protein
MLLRGSVRTAAKRRMGTKIEVVDPVSLYMDLHDWRRMEVFVARSRTCSHVVILLRQRGVRRGRREMCVRRGVKSRYACL